MFCRRAARQKWASDKLFSDRIIESLVVVGSGVGCVWIANETNFSCDSNGFVDVDLDVNFLYIKTGDARKDDVFI